jgi:hypothetical protein
MSLTPVQLQILQNDLAALTSAVEADTAAQAAVANDQTALSTAQTQLNTDTATAQQTSAAVSAAGAQLEADVEADFPPSPAPITAKARGASLRDTIAKAEKLAIGNSRLQNLVCMLYTAYNIFAQLSGQPQLTPPAYCSVPTPTSTP